MDITINGEIVLDEKTCIEENETMELIFDYESRENETEWIVCLKIQIIDFALHPCGWDAK